MNNNALFYECSLIEYIARQTKNSRYDVVKQLGEDLVDGIKEVYGSWMADQILNFNSDLYYQSREYIALCYKEGRMLLA